MMQSNDNNLLLLRLNSKFNLSLRNAAQFNRITIAACFINIRFEEGLLILEMMDFTTIKLCSY